MNPILVKATLEDYPTIQNMARFYVYDMSHFCGRSESVFDWSCPDDGLFECRDFKPYFESADCQTFLIKVGDEKAGFALIDKVGTSPDVDWNVGQFFILAKFQGTGVGKQVAFELFDKYSGVWEVASMLENTGARIFWAKVVENYTDGAFTEVEKMVPEPEPHQMLVFRFESRPG